MDLSRIAFVTLTAKESTGQSFAERVIARCRSQHADFSMEPASHTFLELRSEQRPRLLAHILGDRHGRQFGLCREFVRSEEHTSELQSLMRISYAVFCLKKKTQKTH